MVPIPQEPAGGEGAVVAVEEGAEGGLDVEKKSLPSSSPTMNLLELMRLRGKDKADLVKQEKKQNGRRKEVAGKNVDSMRDMMRKWTGSVSPAVTAAPGLEVGVERC